MFCGDEVAAVVVDMGSSVVKLGTAGEDSPRHVFRSEVGRRPSSPDKAYIDSSLRYSSEHIDIHRWVSHDTVHWQNTEALLNYGIEHMRIDVRNTYAMLFAESHFKAPRDKVKVRR